MVGLLRSLGFWGACSTDRLPEDGFLVIPARYAERIEEAETWAGLRPDRLVLSEPSGGDPVPLSGIPRRLGQRRQIPAAPPKRRRSLDDAYLSEVAAIALAGYEIRLSRHRPFPDEWRAQAARAIDELRTKADDPDSLERLRAQLGRAADLEPVDNQVWRDLRRRLDRRRGLFRRPDPDGSSWQMDPTPLWAIATRLRRYAPRSAGPVEYGVLAHGAAEGPWINSVGDRALRLRASVLTAAAAEVDPPDLAYPYDSSHDAPPPPLHEILSALPESAPSPRPAERPFTLCVRHDVDRPLDSSDMRAHLDLEDSLGLRSTWFFKWETFDEGLGRELVARDREIGYHAELLSTGDDGFLARLARFLGHPVGLTFHRGLGSEAWRGRRSFLDASRLGVAYAELPVGMRGRPQLVPVGKDDWLPLTPLPVEPDVLPERARDHIDTLLAEHGMVVVENHPDLLPDRYRSLLTELAGHGPKRRTVGEAIRDFLPEVVLRSATLPATF